MDAWHTAGPVEVKHSGRTYRVKPSDFCGFSVVEIRNGLAVPVRNIRERNAVIAKAQGAAS